MNDTTPEQTKLSWWRRLSSGLKRTSSSLGSAVADLVTKRKLDRAMLEDIEDVLLRADLGTEVASRIAAAVGVGRYDKAITADDVKTVVATEVEKVLAPVARPLEIDHAKKPFVMLVVGVNGSGKTTTIGKLAAKLSAEGRKVMLAAGDTFRAAAIEQLKIWGERTKSPVIAGAQGSDSASLAFNALTAAKEQNIDVLLIDTAGRLQNKAELMKELEKVVRVIRKVDASAPHAVLLVLDATVGQNALSQVEAFHRTAGVTGLVMTKLDGTARGGILVALVTGAIVLVFGTLTLVLHDETFIKVKPTIIYGLFAAVLGGGLLFGRSFIAIMFDQMFNLTAEGWRQLTMRWAVFFFAMAILNEFIWRTQSTDFWVGFKAFGVLPLTIAFTMTQMPLIKRYHLQPASLETSEADAGDVSKG